MGKKVQTKYQIQRFFDQFVERFFCLMNHLVKTKYILFVLCYQVTTDLYHGCTEEFKGTSASAPLAAGVIALVLEAK